MLGAWFGVPAVGFDTYYVGSKIVSSRINEKTMLKFLGIHEKNGRISHNTLSLCINHFRILPDDSFYHAIPSVVK